MEISACPCVRTPVAATRSRSVPLRSGPSSPRAFTTAATPRSAAAGGTPSWARRRAIPVARKLADKILEAVERDARSLHHPPVVRVLGTLHGISPCAADALLHRLRGSTAAPRRD